MIYLLDTNHLTHPARRQPDPELVARIAEELDARRAATAAVCWFEAWSGAGKARGRRAEIWLRTLASAAIGVLSYDRRASELHADFVRESREGAFSTRAQRDVAIAATALAHGAVLVTDNTRHFAKYVDEGLRLENWLR